MRLNSHHASSNAAPMPATGAVGQQCKVIVIGAGFAGLAAAAALQPLARSGAGVVVLEASDQVGGRARTAQFAGGSVELGATWLHGVGTRENPNPVLAAAMKAGLMRWRPRRQRWWASRFLLPGRAGALQPEEELVVHAAVSAYATAVEEVDPAVHATVGAAADAAWCRLLEGDGVGEGQRGLAAAAWRWREMLQRAIDGADSSHDLSAAGSAAYSEWCGSEVHAAVPCGYQSVARQLAGGLDIRLGHAVECIEWGAGGVAVSCANGASFAADAAVVTVPLGVLKAQHAAMFSPPLPQAKSDAIQRLRTGVVDKFIIDFGPVATAPEEDSVPAEPGAAAGPHDDRSTVSYALLWDADSSGSGAGVAAAASDGAAGVPAWARSIFSLRFGGPEFKSGGPHIDEEVGGVEGGTAVRGGGTSSDEEEQEWVGGPPGPPLHRQAVAWLTGSAAAAMEAASDGEVLAAARAVVEHFPGVQLPEGATWDGARLVRSRWGADPLARGSYSYVGKDATPEDVAALAAPVAAPSGAAPPRTVLAFAGEACHLRYIGTTHGAFMTGQQAAARLLEEYGSEGEGGAW